MRFLNPLKKHHRIHKVVNCRQTTLYDVVANVNAYDTFLPYCQKSQVVDHDQSTNDSFQADLTIGFGYFTESYRSQVWLKRPQHIRIECIQSPTFTSLTSEWNFQPGPTPFSSLVDFNVSFELNSLVHAQAIELFFNDVVQAQMEAFVFQSQSPVQYINRLLLQYPHDFVSLWEQLRLNPSPAFDFFRLEKNCIHEVNNVVGLTMLLQGSFEERSEYLFDAIDTNQDGVIDREELTRALRFFFVKNSDLVVNQIFQQADLDQSDSICYAEWQWLVRINPTVSQWLSFSAT